ncbi:MAG: chromosomal replication initiator protein DnaA [Sedimentisphaerales bacterium]|nr:chromosomal replication initiator protein DnaA [Sedimentisphaerales bacterium]
MQATFTDEVGAIDKAIEQKIGPQKHRVWFHNATRFSLSQEHLTIGVPNHFIGNWIESHFLSEIRQAVEETTGTHRKVVFVIDPELAQSQKKIQPIAPSSVRDERDKVTQTRMRKHAPASPEAPLKLRLDSFVVGAKNELAFNAARAVIQEEQSPFNPLFIHGGYGVGKTHLLQGICNEIALSRTPARWMYVSAEDFANQYVLALKTRKLDLFRNRFRQLDLLAIDDIHFLANKNAMQEEFLHTFNTIDLAGKQIVLASDAHPKMIGQLCDKLVNRFISGMVVKIEPPDFEMRCRICRQRAEQMNKSVPDNVVRFIAERIASNVRELEGALLKLIAYASLSQQRITLGMAQEVLAEHISRTDPIVHISEIESSVANYFGVTLNDLHSSKKDRTISTARSFGMYLARRYTKMSYPEIGRIMGGKNHATVILANRKVEDLVQRNAQVRWIGSTGNRIAPAKDVLDQLVNTIA